MSLRISSAALALVGILAACGANTTPEPSGERVECAIGPGAEFQRVCTLEELPQAQFVIHHPDGGFRRFMNDDEGLNIADGAEPISMNILDGVELSVLEFSVGSDRYRIPQEMVARSPHE